MINAAGSQFTCNYGDVTNPAQRDFASIRNIDDFYAQRLMICYEFVHYVAPDSSPEGYVNFVKQYAVWTRLERWNRDQFAENVIARSKKNAAAVRQPWSNAVEQQVRALLPGRWADIQSVLQAADAVRR